MDLLICLLLLRLLCGRTLFSELSHGFLGIIIIASWLGKGPSKMTCASLAKVDDASLHYLGDIDF